MELIQEMQSVIQVIKIIVANSYLLAFSVLFIIGYLLKEHTTFNNKLIPWVLFIMGILIGLSIVSFTKEGAAVGAIMSWAIMGFYEHIRDSIFLLLKVKESSSSKKVRK